MMMMMMTTLMAVFLGGKFKKIKILIGIVNTRMGNGHSKSYLYLMLSIDFIKIK